MKAAHLILYALPPEAVDYICGLGTGSRQFSWENGLMLHNRLEKHLENGDIVTLPVQNSDTRPTEFIMKIAVSAVADTAIDCHRSTIVTLEDLDGKKLEWKNEKRPMLRFLYWRYITSMLGNRKNQPDQAKAYYDQLKSAEPFVTLKPYLRKGVLLTMAREAGCVNDEVISKTLAKIEDDDDVVVGD